MNEIQQRVERSSYQYAQSTHEARDQLSANWLGNWANSLDEDVLMSVTGGSKTLVGTAAGVFTPNSRAKE